ncbi:MAG: acyl-CoA thioesterase [Bacteroidetes bacterium]|nr:acyl-CoA thioesterase [Bacteroidota bacterium]
MWYISTKVCKTSDIGVSGNLFGGTMMAWLDEAGATLACSLCCTPNMITLKMEEVLFKKPVKVGQHIRIYGKAERIGRTSLTLFLEARLFDFLLKEEDPVCSTRIIFVKINDEGTAIPIEEEIKEKIMKGRALRNSCKPYPKNTKTC